MVAVMLDGPEGVERRLRALVQPILKPYWMICDYDQQTIEDHERAAELLDLLIDILEDSGIGVQRRLVPAEEVVEWSSERRLVAPANEAGFRLAVNPEGGINIRINFEDKTFVEHGLTPEAIATLINSFCNLRLASPYR